MYLYTLCSRFCDWFLHLVDNGPVGLLDALHRVEPQHQDDIERFKGARQQQQNYILS